MATKVEKFLEGIKLVEDVVQKMHGKIYMIDGRPKMIIFTGGLCPRKVQWVAEGLRAPAIRIYNDAVRTEVYIRTVSSATLAEWQEEIDYLMSLREATPAELHAAQLESVRKNGIERIRSMLDAMEARVIVGAERPQWGKVIMEITKLQMQEW